MTVSKYCDLLENMRVLSLVVALGFSILAHAEPWLANRFAQNCTACHSPGRPDVSFSQKRCTATCQGCHISPNGGGLRGAHGKWNESKWLRSFYLETWRPNSKTPAPLAEQKFNEENLKRFIGNPNQEKEMIERGIPMKGSDSQTEDPKYIAPMMTENDPQKFMYRVPAGDPLRQKQEQWFTAGADLRYFLLNTSGKTEVNGESTPAESKQYSAFMGLDIGVEVSPVQPVHFVFEHRYGNPPSHDHWDQLFTGQSAVKSAYVLVDDLPYNSWIQSGLYRPLFGHSNPDHNTLLNQLTGFTQFVTYNTTSIGTAPGAPFFNLHLISKKSGIEDEPGKAAGTAFNLGARFVSYGLSLMISNWNTTADTATQSITRKMTAFDLGTALGRYVGNINLTRVELRVPDQSQDKGTIVTLENKYRFWRESYMVLNYAFANTTRLLKEGTSNQLGYGIRTFWLSGLETEVLMTTTKEKVEATQTTVTDNYAQLQAHFFF